MLPASKKSLKQVVNMLHHGVGVGEGLVTFVCCEPGGFGDAFGCLGRSFGRMGCGHKVPPGLLECPTAVGVVDMEGGGEERSEGEVGDACLFLHLTECGRLDLFVGFDHSFGKIPSLVAVDEEGLAVTGDDAAGGFDVEEGFFEFLEELVGADAGELNGLAAVDEGVQCRFDRVGLDDAVDMWLVDIEGVGLIEEEHLLIVNS